MEFLPDNNRRRGERFVLHAVARCAGRQRQDEPTTTNQDPETAMQGESRMAKQGTATGVARRNRVLGWMAVAVTALGLGAGVAQAAPSDIYRFYHLDAGRHFYTASTVERDKVLNLYPRFAYEGPRFQAYLTQETGTVPVYRFYHQGNGSHVYSASETEKSTILSNYPIYAYEGIAYYAESNGNSGAVAVLRLYNTKLGTHFFTTSASEAAYAVNTWPWFVFEGPMFYVRETTGTPPAGNAAPVATLSVSAQSVTAGTPVTITSTATDMDGTIAKVDFYQGTTNIGTVSTAPYSITYTFTQAGSFMIGAVATDNAGATGAATPVQVTVTAAGGGGGGGNPPPPPPPTGGNIPPSVALSASATAVTTGDLDDADRDRVGPRRHDRARSSSTTARTLLTTDTTAPYTYDVHADGRGHVSRSRRSRVRQPERPDARPRRDHRHRRTRSVAASAAAHHADDLTNTLFTPGAGTVTLTGNRHGHGHRRHGHARVVLHERRASSSTTRPRRTRSPRRSRRRAHYDSTRRCTDSLGKVQRRSTQTRRVQTAPAVDDDRMPTSGACSTRRRSARRRPKPRACMSLGIAGWINDQFTKPISGYPDTQVQPDPALDDGGLHDADAGRRQLSGRLAAGDVRSRSPDARDASSATSSPTRSTAPDQLRQRVAWALSQIVVTSANEPDLAYAHVMSRYQNIMFEEAFGNYETLLRKVTYNPAMGNYLDMVNNDRPGRHARAERELRSRDHAAVLGRPRTSSTPTARRSSTPRASRSRPTARPRSRSSRGSSPATRTRARPTRTARPPASRAATTARRWCRTRRRPPRVTTRTPRRCCNGTVLPAGQTRAGQDVDAAVRNVFMHPNTGPFVAQAADPAPRDRQSVAGLRGARRRGVQQQRQPACAATSRRWCRRSCSIRKRAARRRRPPTSAR